MPSFGLGSNGADTQRSSLDTLMSRLRVDTASRHRAAAAARSSKWSSPVVSDSIWAADSFMLGVGMIIFQVPSFKVVVIEDTEVKYWFFPKGRKDIGESLEAAALREAYEEAGYRAEFLPILTRTKAPAPPGQENLRQEPNTEPFYLSMMGWLPKMRADGRVAPGGEYLTHWYVGSIEEDAVSETGTGMPDELNYRSHILEYREALRVLDKTYGLMLRYAFELVSETYPEHTKHVYQDLPPTYAPAWRLSAPAEGQSQKGEEDRSSTEMNRQSRYEDDNDNATNIPLAS